MRITFRKLQRDYLEKVRIWRNKPEIKKYMYTDHDITVEEHNRWFENVVFTSETFKFWLVFRDEDPVGAIHIYDIDYRNKRAYWGYYLAEESAKGIGLGKLIELNVMRYLFEELNLNKLCCEVFSFNDFVVKLHEKYGSSVEGEFKDHIYKNGTFYDIICMAILKDKWKIDEKNRDYDIIPFE